MTLSISARHQMDSLLSSQPDTGPWLGVLSAVLEEASDDPSGARWDAVAACTILADTSRESGGGRRTNESRMANDFRPPTSDLRPRPPGTPLLAGARIPIDAPLADRWVRHLLTLAAEAGPEANGLRAAAGDGALDTRTFLEAAVNADADRLEAIARSLDIDADALAAVAALAVMPLLQALRRRFGPAVDAGWHEGYCPICGGWPHLAEQRGLERARRLRCARCGGDWVQPGIRCPYCGVVGHGVRAALVSEQDGEARKVETCSACRGYLKSVSTLRAWAADEVALTDLATVDLDLIALERDFERPQPRQLEPGARVIG